MANSIFLPSTNYHAKERHAGKATILDLLDYRCHVQGGQINTSYPPSLAKCLAKLKAMSTDDISDVYGERLPQIFLALLSGRGAAARSPRLAALARGVQDSHRRDLPGYSSTGRVSCWPKALSGPFWSRGHSTGRASNVCHTAAIRAASLMSVWGTFSAPTVTGFQMHRSSRVRSAKGRLKWFRLFPNKAQGVSESKGATARFL